MTSSTSKKRSPTTNKATRLPSSILPMSPLIKPMLVDGEEHQGVETHKDKDEIDHRAVRGREETTRDWCDSCAAGYEGVEELNKSTRRTA